MVYEQWIKKYRDPKYCYMVAVVGSLRQQHLYLPNIVTVFKHVFKMAVGNYTLPPSPVLEIHDTQVSDKWKNSSERGLTTLWLPS